MKKVNENQIENKLKNIIDIVLDIEKDIKTNNKNKNKINNKDKRPAGISYVYNNSHIHFINSLRN